MILLLRRVQQQTLLPCTFLNKKEAIIKTKQEDLKGTILSTCDNHHNQNHIQRPEKNKGFFNSSDSTVNCFSSVTAIVKCGIFQKNSRTHTLRPAIVVP